MHRVPGTSERRACRVLRQARGTQRYVPRKKADEAALVKAMHGLVRAHPRFGYRRIHALLRRDGWRINRKRVHRLWKREGFKVPQTQVKKTPVGIKRSIDHA